MLLPRARSRSKSAVVGVPPPAVGLDGDARIGPREVEPHPASVDAPQLVLRRRAPAPSSGGRARTAPAPAGSPGVRRGRPPRPPPGAPPCPAAPAGPPVRARTAGPRGDQSPDHGVLRGLTHHREAVTAPRSSNVRATVVTGMPSLAVMSMASRRSVRCTVTRVRAATAAAGDGDLGPPSRHVPQLPQPGRAAVRRHRHRTRRPASRPAAGPGRRGDGHVPVDPRVDHLEEAQGHEVLELPVAHPDRCDVPAAHEAQLPRGHLRQPQIRPSHGTRVNSGGVTPTSAARSLAAGPHLL